MNPWSYAGLLLTMVLWLMSCNGDHEQSQAQRPSPADPVRSHLPATLTDLPTPLRLPDAGSQPPGSPPSLPTAVAEDSTVPEPQDRPVRFRLDEGRLDDPRYTLTTAEP
ncbi:MAG: hypothetical protein FJZ47_07060 [Candidatus Tectomicrobia bacterium]|uniref:Uncharacterized protein n=1 Tax=Tectimicrobiota bacterium TaxID=2528274 RepID=A0A938B382_UNCTE|nr:hypothetical protein [Candidatus Tectomicrobia bacterium]